MTSVRSFLALPLFMSFAHVPLAATDEPADPQNACQIVVDYDAVYEEAVVSALAELDDYDELCVFLEERNLHVVLRGSGGILEGRAYAWALVTLANSETGMDAGGHQTVTLLGTPADSVEERRVLFAVMERALEIVADHPARFISSGDAR